MKKILWFIFEIWMATFLLGVAILRPEATIWFWMKVAGCTCWINLASNTYQDL